MSGESRGYGTTCQTARFRGSIVRIRELHFEKKKDIPRDVMKEMKVMRELRHDNINRYTVLYPLISRQVLRVKLNYVDFSIILIFSNKYALQKSYESHIAIN